MEEDSSSTTPARSSARKRQKSKRLLSLEGESSALNYETVNPGYTETRGRRKVEKKRGRKPKPPPDETTKVIMKLSKIPKLKIKAVKSVPKLKVTLGENPYVQQADQHADEMPEELSSEDGTYSEKDDLNESVISFDHSDQQQEFMDFDDEDEEVEVDSDMDDEPPPPADIEVEAPECSADDGDGDSDEGESIDPVEVKPKRPEGKRQTKKPAKLKDDYVELKYDKPRLNKAAKFFEARKTENQVVKKESAKKSGKEKRSRMPSAYTMWCNSYRSKIQQQNPGIDFATLNKKLGEIWWSIPLKEKEIWKRKARRIATHGLPKAGDNVKLLGKNNIRSLKNKFGEPVPIPTLHDKEMQETVKREINITQRHTTEPIYKVTQTEPVDIAAYMTVMGESLTSIGKGLSCRGDQPVQGSTDMMLDSLFCAMGSLMCITQQIPELDRDADPTMHKTTMSNISHFLPDV